MLEFKAIGERTGTTKLAITVDGKQYRSKDFYPRCELMYDYMPHDVVAVEIVSRQGKSIQIRVMVADGREFKGSAHLKRQRNVENIGSRQGGGPRSCRRQF